MSFQTHKTLSSIEHKKMFWSCSLHSSFLKLDSPCSLFPFVIRSNISFFSFVFNGRKSSQLVVDGHEGEFMTTELSFLSKRKSSYPLFPDTRCLVSAEVSQHCCLWLSDGENRVMFCSSVVALSLIEICIQVGFPTLTRCPMAKANDFWTTLLRSLIPFRSALMSLPVDAQTHVKDLYTY